MRTTIRIDDRLLVEAKKRAAEDGTTLTALIDEALRDRLADSAAGEGNPSVELPAFEGGGGLAPGVNLADNAALRDRMDGLR